VFTLQSLVGSLQTMLHATTSPPDSPAEEQQEEEPQVECRCPGVDFAVQETNGTPIRPVEPGTELHMDSWLSFAAEIVLWRAQPSLLVWGARAFVALDALFVITFFAWRLHCWAKSAWRRRRLRQLERVQSWVCGELPEVKCALVYLKGMASASISASDFATVAQRLAEIFERTGKDLKENMPEDSMLKETFADLLTDWHDVGDANTKFSRQMWELGTSLKKRALDLDNMRSEMLAQVQQLQVAFVMAESRTRGCRRRLRGCSVAALAQEQLRCRCAELAAELRQLAETAEAQQQLAGAGLTGAGVEMRRLAQVVGERMAQLRPIPRSHRGQFASDLVKSLSTAEGRQKHLDSEAAEAARVAALQPQKVHRPLDCPKADSVGAGEWWVHGLYEHQVLKIGLRILDRDWGIEKLFDFPRAGVSGLLRQKQICDLLSGTLALQAMPSNDVAAAQLDMRALSLRQLLRLRVRHINFVPSGCGSNTVTGVGDAHEALLGLLDRLLFQRLGRSAVGSLPSSGPLNDSDAHRLGREAVLFTAVAAAITSPPWWSWWLAEDHLVFLHPVNFTCSPTFPADGVLDVADHSKLDKNDPRGVLRYLDWQVKHVAAQKSLSAVRPHDAVGSQQLDLDGGDESKAAGAATASMVSPELLQNSLSSLRRTGLH